MSLSKLFSGRKRDSVWWEFFSYDDSCDKSTCLVADETTKAVCGTQIAGKNTSNFAAHIKRFHKHAHETCVRKEMEKVSAKNQAVKRDISGSSKSQTLKECINRRIVSWPKESVEHRVRVQSILKMVIGTSTGGPTIFPRHD